MLLRPAAAQLLLTHCHLAAEKKQLEQSEVETQKSHSSELAKLSAGQTKPSDSFGLAAPGQILSLRLVHVGKCLEAPDNYEILGILCAPEEEKLKWPCKSFQLRIIMFKTFILKECYKDALEPI